MRTLPCVVEEHRHLLVEIESGSRDIEGLGRIANVIAARLKALGGKVELVDPELEEQRGKVGKMVRATFTGTGTRNILLLAHMDTVYPRGRLAGQPYLINKLGAEHDTVMSFEGGGSPKVDNLRLATSGVARATLIVRGRASHAGSAPELGVNALYEMAHQVLQARDLSDEKAGIKVNWTLANAGIVGNMIPPGAQASATVRVERVADHDVVEKKLRELIKNK